MSKVWQKWKETAEKIGSFQASIIFSILYFILITPVGIVTSLFTDPLRLRKFPEWEKIDRENKIHIDLQKNN